MKKCNVHRIASFFKEKTTAKYCAFEYLSNGTKFITIEKFLEKLLPKEKRVHTYPEQTLV